MTNVFHDECLMKLRVLNEEIWEGRVRREQIEAWLANFAADEGDLPSERAHALYLLTHFMYFGSREIRGLLVSLYRDAFRYPIVEKIRRENGDSRDVEFLEAEFHAQLLRTRFLGVGNPSESGQHLLYYLRQENRLPSRLFINTHEIVRTEATGDRLLADKDVQRYVFIDDFCGSGDQAKRYSRDILEEIHQLDPSKELCYYALFATERGLEEVRANTKFDRVASVVAFDESYKAFGADSRYFAKAPSDISREFAHDFCRRYGETLCPRDPVGYRDGQLMLGFMHNVPNNSLPVFWASDKKSLSWTPIFRRYPKFAMKEP